MKSKSPKNEDGLITKVKEKVSNVFSSEEETNGLREVFIQELKDLYYVEKALVKELPNLASAATSVELVSAISNHHSETKNQVARLDQIFDMMGISPEEKKCNAMNGLLEEADSGIAATTEGTKVRDVVLITCAQKVEHYEIATYGTLRTIAQVLNMPAVEKLLEETLEEEKNADLLLSSIAQGFVNIQAKEESETIKNK